MEIGQVTGKKRTPGIAAYEDKIVQLGLRKILDAVYEPKFRENMYGFHPGRNCHMAVNDMRTSIIRKRIGIMEYELIFQKSGGEKNEE